MPSASPSPGRRPPLTERTSSTHSLSSSGKPANTGGHKPHRAHTASRHSRNLSHGKGLTKLGKVNSSTNVAAGETRPHQRKKSGHISPSQSPKIRAAVKRNSSHVALTKNNSHGNLRRNHSEKNVALTRNTSHPGLKKLGLPPTPKAKEEDKKGGFFQLGDRSSDEDEEEGEWEDSMTHSPEVTRNNSKVSTPARAATPLGGQVSINPSEPAFIPPEKSSSPPEPSLKIPNRSLPDLRRDNLKRQEPTPDPALLLPNPRSTRAPPAMSTVSARAQPPNITRSESTRSFTHISHADADSPKEPTMTGGSSSADGGVSHFLSTSIPDRSRASGESLSESDSPSNFMSFYKPQPAESPEKAKTLLNKSRAPHVPSRTQQKLELQRREAMRAGAAPSAAPPAPNSGMSFGSSVSLHSTSGSRGRNRSLAGEIKAQKQDYETGIRQLTVVRRFRNPILESLGRLKDRGTIPANTGAITPSGAAMTKNRPQSRRGLSQATNTSMTGSKQTTTANNTVSSTRSGRNSPEPKKSSHPTSRPETQPRGRSQGGGSRVRFQRDDSHDDMGGMTAAQETLDGLVDDEEVDGVSPEEALIRRLWGSREIYDVDNHTISR